MQRMTWWQRIIVYGLLAAGAFLFSIPFVWMAATSVKVNRELYPEEVTILPITPRPQIRSPYMDETYYAHLKGPHQAELLPAFEALVAASGFEAPAAIPRAVAHRSIARGLYKKMTRRLPQDVWTRSAADVLAASKRKIDAEVVAGVFKNLHRELRFGQIRVRSKDLKEHVLGEGVPMSRRLENRTPEPEVLGLVDSPPGAPRPYAAAHYDFAKGERFVLSRTFRLPFPARDLQRIQLYVRPDDTWHDLTLTVERGGKLYRARRSVALANFEWTRLTWQEPGPDDLTTKIKTWILLDEADRSDAYASGPNELKLIFEVRRVGPAGAWSNKLERNYARVIDQMPLARYIRTSLFLVVANIALTLLFSSLVAYAFARLQWPGREVCFILVLSTMMIPPQVTMIPHFLIWRWLGAYDTLTPLWLGAAFGNAFFIFLLRQFMLGIPRDLEDAARIDGCGPLRIYWHIILPLIKPSLAAIAIFTFIGTWNDFMGPLIYISDQRLYPLSFGLYAFSVQVQNDPALTMAASLVMTLPVIVIFFFAQRYFIQGVALTGMKQ